MTQSIIIQVGQCGNQIGCRFWDLALREHASVNKNGVYDEAMNSFFRNVDARSADSADIPLGKKPEKISCLKARCILVDMEEGVVSEMMRGPLRDVFEHRQLITDVSGSGNNWAVGHHEYGPKYREQISESIRRAAEHCDCLQCFFLLHSMGGGTGSGVGTYILGLLQEEYPEVYRFVTSVYPSSDDDVITSPYNSVLAMRCLIDSADCVLPIENQALFDIVSKMPQLPDKSGKCSNPADSKPFDSMNSVVANLLLNLTSSSRFQGSLNVDLNEITMNLVPFPRMHFLVSSQTPLYTYAQTKIPARRLDQMFSDAFCSDHQLLRCDPKHNLYLACALMIRGNVEISDVRRNIDRLRPSLKFVQWNQDGWKTGLCSVPPVGHSHSLLSLANNTCITANFTHLKERFVKLYKRKAHVCHYTRVDNMEESEMRDSLESLNSIIEEYRNIDLRHSDNIHTPRLQVNA